MAMKVFSGITAKVTQLAWTVTLGSLCIFIAFIIPEQTRELRDGLESKAHGITAALQGEVAGAAISEDYSSVVEHAMQVVAGDPAVQFLVITKNDGYSVVVTRNGWRMIPRIGADWYRGPRVPTSTIGVVNLIGKRSFHYSTPFDYNGIQWGWVHAGLSLDAYDENVRNIYQRTGMIGALCMILGLFASILFARRFVKPVLSLRATVEQLARGDLSARAQVKGNNEIEDLADTFNDMAGAVLHRDEIVESVRFVAEALQRTDDWDTVAGEIMAVIGKTTDVCRVLLVEFQSLSAPIPMSRICLEWSNPGDNNCGSVPAKDSLEELGLLSQLELLRTGQTVVTRGPRADITSIPGPDCQPMSAIITPILADDLLWGALIVQDSRRDRDWHEVEQHSVRAIADMLGASIVRQAARHALVEAKNQLEQRVEERTLELRDEISAKDRAHEELKKAQKQLIDLSRLSGMAEVATGVLHNVGNVLNSINVTANLLMDHLNASRLAQLRELSDLLSKNSGALAQFLIEDPRGSRTIPYLTKLSAHLLEERGQMLKDAEALVQNVGHVKEIVAMQQGYARACGVFEKIAPRELIDDTLNISGPALDRHHIVLKKDIEPIDTFTTARHRVLQILLNLVQHAKEAVKSGNAATREISIRLHRAGNDRVQFQVEDNGIGIAPDDLTRIFSHGFTTKKDGHGFGLHSGALAAKQLGGDLKVASAGLNHGALFTLELPIYPRLADGQGAAIEHRV